MGSGNYDAVLLVSFGGPERREDVIPFLENVTRGRSVPPERLLEVAKHYYEFGGKSPINDQNRLLEAALRTELSRRGPELPVYWGNRNWHPLLRDTIRTMATEGVKRAIAFVTSAYSSYSGCRQYRENIEEARDELGGLAPKIDKIRPFFNHPGFIEAMAHLVRSGLDVANFETAREFTMLYSAHSIPSAMAETCRYVDQLKEAAGLVSERVGIADWELVFQSRSGPPSQPWLGPDINDRLRTLPSQGVKRVCVTPIGFLSDHIEVLHDLDTEAAGVAKESGLGFIRTPTVGTDPRFVAGVRDLIAERVLSSTSRKAVGAMPPCPDVCPADCCPRPPSRRHSGQCGGGVSAQRARPQG
ncbi:MAG: ferrochelatase [Bryobacterales bacterium]|nr:ferrochelatase [Bryobacterales bacterium]